MFGHTLAIFLAHKKGTSIEEYGFNHPSGTIGKRLSLFTEDVMLSLESTPTCSPDAKVVDALLQANNRKLGACILLEGTKVYGIVTDGDFRRAILKDSEQTISGPVKNICTKNPKCISKSSKAWDALLLMKKHNITLLPVVHEGDLVGCIHMHQLLHLGLG